MTELFKAWIAALVEEDLRDAVIWHRYEDTLPPALVQQDSATARQIESNIEDVRNRGLNEELVRNDSNVRAKERQVPGRVFKCQITRVSFSPC